MNFGPGLQKVKNIGDALDSGEPGMTNLQVTTLRLVSHRWLSGYAAKGDRHVGKYDSRDISVDGLRFYRDSFFYLLFRPLSLPAELAKRDSTKIGHIHVL